jgi:hypothetical protein
MVILKVNNTEFPNPSKMQVTIEDWDASTSSRLSNGELARDRVAVKRKIEVEYALLDGNQMSAILKATEDVFFSVTYFDPKENGFLTKTMYVGNRTPSFYMLRDDKVLYRDFKFSLIEK